MNKPFDLADLAAKLKAKGLPVLEDQIQLLTEVTLDWTAESCVLKGGMLAMVAAGIPFVKEQLLELEDKIDGVDAQAAAPAAAPSA